MTDESKGKHAQMVRDRWKVKQFIYELGVDCHKLIMHNNPSDKLYLDMCQGIVDRCNAYPDNEYGKPDIYAVMSEVYRRVNYHLSEIDAHSGF